MQCLIDNLKILFQKCLYRCISKQKLKENLGNILFRISNLQAFESENFHCIFLMSEATCRRNFMEIWSTCKCVILPLNAGND